MTDDQHTEELALSDLRDVRGHHLVIAACLGATVGGVALLFQTAVAWVSSVQNSLTSIVPSVALAAALLVIVCASTGALAGILTSAVAPEAGGSGIPHVKAVLAHLQTMRGLRILIVKFIGGALAIGNHFSLGREGPTVHLGAALGDELAKLSKAPRHLKDHLIACGAGAGLAAAFNAPLAGFLFVIEELRRDVTSITLGMALLGTVLADSIVQLGVGSGPNLSVTHIVTPHISAVPAIVIISLGAAGAGLLFNETLMAVVRWFPSSIPLWVRGIVAGFLVACGILLVPGVTEDIQSIFDNFVARATLTSISLSSLGILFLLKLILTVACYATGVPGGIFAPILAQGVFVGLLCGALAAFLPLPVPEPTVCALLGMTAFFAASVRAPFTGVVLLAEMTNGFSLLLPLMGAALVAYFIAELLGTKPIYERLLQLSLERAQERSAADPT